MKTSQEINVHLDTADKLTEMLRIFYNKKPKVSVTSGLTGFSQNAETLSAERMAEADFQPLGYIEGDAIVVYRTHDGREVGYGIFDETSYTILTMDLLVLIGQILPDEDVTPAQLASINLVVNNMEGLVGIQYA